MNVLITGADGRLGRALIGRAPPSFHVSGIDVEDCDFTDLAMLRARLLVEAPDIILNAAAYTAVDRAETEQDVVWAVNADAVAVMADVMDKTGGKLVHISSDLVFDGTSSRPYKPTDLRNPLSVYGASKARGEDQLGPHDLLLRCGWLYEANGKYSWLQMIRLMREYDSVSFIADQIMSPTRMEGFADAIWALIDQCANGIFHYADGGHCSFYEFAVALATEAHALGLLARTPAILPITRTDAKPPASRPVFSPLDCEATFLELGVEQLAWRANLRNLLLSEVGAGRLTAN